MGCITAYTLKQFGIW